MNIWSPGLWGLGRGPRPLSPEVLCKIISLSIDLSKTYLILKKKRTLSSPLRNPLYILSIKICQALNYFITTHIHAHSYGLCLYVYIHRQACNLIWAPRARSSVCWGSRIHWLHLCRGEHCSSKCPGYDIKPWWGSSFGECEVLFHCHCSQVHSDPE